MYVWWQKTKGIEEPTPKYFDLPSSLCRNFWEDKCPVNTFDHSLLGTKETLISQLICPLILIANVFFYFLGRLSMNCNCSWKESGNHNTKIDLTELHAPRDPFFLGNFNRVLIFEMTDLIQWQQKNNCETIWF